LKKSGKTLTLDVTIPVNATAEVFLPASLKNIKERGIPVSGNGAIQFKGTEKKESIFALGSGTYQFTVQLEDQ
jgi:hypothetical protein